jgi:GTP-binding protein HflX
VPKELFTPEQNRREKAFLVGIRHGKSTRSRALADLAELAQLARSAELDVAGQLLAPVQRIDPAWYVGKGKVEEILARTKSDGAQAVIFDETLTPAQVRNLEEKFQLKVLDRGNLVLDIFARRARTREAKTQVELAQLEYLLPRLTGLWEHFSRHVGGVGTKGPGETQLEVDRRLTRTRISHLKKLLAKIELSREVQRTRRRQNVKVCALVGYTNAGKSSLFNRLSRSEVAAENRMFSSLDAKSSRVHLRTAEGANGAEVVLVDTVGFVSKLPPQLVASFRSTLEELSYADLLLGVLDLAHPDAVSHIEEVRRVITDLKADHIPRLWLLNKSDLVDRERVLEVTLALEPDFSLPCSAATGEGISALSLAVRDRLGL